jgi:hypothetical protein
VESNETHAPFLSVFCMTDQQSTEYIGGGKGRATRVASTALFFIVCGF